MKCLLLEHAIQKGELRYCKWKVKMFINVVFFQLFKENYSQLTAPVRISEALNDSSVMQGLGDSKMPLLAVIWLCLWFLFSWLTVLLMLWRQNQPGSSLSLIVTVLVVINVLIIVLDAHTGSFKVGAICFNHRFLT